MVFTDLAKAAIAAVEEHEDLFVDCQCDHVDYDGWCWYRLTDEEKAKHLVEFVAEALSAAREKGEA